MNVLDVQRALQDAGFDPGPLDGKMGPKTKAAISAYQQKFGLVVDGIVGPKTAASLGVALHGGSTSASTPSASGGGATSTPSASGGADAATQQAYPQYAWLYGDPELGPLLRQATSEGWTMDRLEGAMQQTGWWKNHAADARSYLQLAATDPAEATRRLNNYDSIAKYMAMANSYGMKVSFQHAADQVDRVVRGDVAPDALTQELRNMAKNLYGWDSPVGKAIDNGQTVADVFEPYKQLAVSILGLNPADVRLSDPKWNSLLQVTDAPGGPRLPTQDEVATRLRTDPTYGYVGTQAGRDSGFGLINAINDGFGLSQIQ